MLKESDWPNHEPPLRCRRRPALWLTTPDRPTIVDALDIRLVIESEEVKMIATSILIKTDAFSHPPTVLPLLWPRVSLCLFLPVLLIMSSQSFIFLNSSPLFLSSSLLYFQSVLLSIPLSVPHERVFVSICVCVCVCAYVGVCVCVRPMCRLQGK